MWMLGLVWPLMLASSPTGESCTEDLLSQGNERCCKECPAGYHKGADCADKTYKCKICGKGSFTSIPNSVDECERCSSCNTAMSVVVSNCSKIQNVICGCKKEAYSTSIDKSQLHCNLCSSCQNCSMCPTCEKCVPCKTKDQIKNCCRGKACLKYLQATTTTHTPTTKNQDLKITVIGSKNQPDILHHTVFLLSVAFMAVLVLSLLLFYLKGRIFRREGGQGWCFKPTTNLKLPARNSHTNGLPCHQSSNPTSQTLNLCEGIPVVHSCQHGGTQHSAHFPPLLPDPQIGVLKQEAEMECWPAIVLYAIIKEVPLRRWKEFLRRLSVAETQLERVEFETNPALGSLERQYQMLRLWSRRATATLEDVFSALHYMELTGCAQQLQDNLDKLQWSTNIVRAVAMPVTSLQHDWTAEASTGHLEKEFTENRTEL